jgi:phosphatidylglycerol---prolipoprotein diacylglyceryl transferase
MNKLSLADLLSGGWLHIGPPYIYINIDPVLVSLGPLAVRWYGLMYVVGIMMGLWIIKGYTTRKGIDQDMVYRVLWWCIVAGLIGGRLYFVIQQPNLVSGYLLQPQHILATWEGGMAFYGAIFLVIPTLIWRARHEHINPLVLVDAGVLFAAAGQIFGRIGNLINGDIIGYPSTLPWSTVYVNPNSWACLNPATCNVPVQPAAGYELIINIIVLSTMLYLSYRLRRPGILMLIYLFSYAISQFLIFFTRANDIVSFLGLNLGLKQAQWTSIIVFILLLPLTYWVLRTSKPVPVDEVAATYGIPQPEKPKHPLEPKVITENLHTIPESVAAANDESEATTQTKQDASDQIEEEVPQTEEKITPTEQPATLTSNEEPASEEHVNPNEPPTASADAEAKQNV